MFVRAHVCVSVRALLRVSVTAHVPAGERMGILERSFE